MPAWPDWHCSLWCKAGMGVRWRRGGGVDVDGGVDVGGGGGLGGLGLRGGCAHQLTIPTRR